MVFQSSYPSDLYMYMYIVKICRVDFFNFGQYINQPEHPRNHSSQPEPDSKMLDAISLMALLDIRLTSNHVVYEVAVYL